MGEYGSVEPIGNQYAIVMNSEYRKGIVEVMTDRIAIPFGEYHDFIYNDNVLLARINQGNLVLLSVYIRWALKITCSRQMIKECC